MAKMQVKIQVWQAKINLNCQTKNKIVGKIYWTGGVPGVSNRWKPIIGNSIDQLIYINRLLVSIGIGQSMTNR